MKCYNHGCFCCVALLIDGGEVGIVSQFDCCSSHGNKRVSAYRDMMICVYGRARSFGGISIDTALDYHGRRVWL